MVPKWPSSERASEQHWLATCALQARPMSTFDYVSRVAFPLLKKYNVYSAGMDALNLHYRCCIISCKSESLSFVPSGSMISTRTGNESFAFYL